MNKLQKITQYLTSAGLANGCKLDAWIEEGEIQPSAKKLGTGVKILSMSYRGVISVEQYAGSADFLAAMVAIWMQENATVFDDSNVMFDADKRDDELFDIELQFNLVDDVEMVQDDNGNLTFNGQSYSIESAPYWVAEEIDVDADITG